MALAGSRTRQKQRIPLKFVGISGITCRSLTQYITHKALSPRNLRRLFPGTLTGCHSGDGRHWVRLHWLAAGGQMGRSRLMTSRDRVLYHICNQSTKSQSNIHKNNQWIASHARLLVPKSSKSFPKEMSFKIALKTVDRLTQPNFLEKGIPQCRSSDRKSSITIIFQLKGRSRNI